MLPVNVDQYTGKLFQQPRVDRFSIHLTDAALGHNSALQDHKAVFLNGNIQLFHLLNLRLLIQLEHQLDQGKIRARPDHVPITAAPQSQAHRTDDNGFSRSGLTCQDVQMGTKKNLGLLNQCQIFHM